MSGNSFESLGLSPWLAQTCTDHGMTIPTPVQIQCIPQILKGRDVIGRAQTGSGKTAAFALPIIEKLSEDPYGIFAIILTPTRELAIQIGDAFQTLGIGIRVRVSVIVGGEDFAKQKGALKELPHIVVATPGRLAEFISEDPPCKMNFVRFLVLDEADRLLDHSFISPVQTIVDFIPPATKRQTLLFSATMTDSLEKLKHVAMNKPFVCEIDAKFQTVDTLLQEYLLMSEHVKACYLVYLLKIFKDSSVIVFTSTILVTELLYRMAKFLNIKAAVIHSVMNQDERIESLNSFKSQYCNLLFATDIAARGLDIPAVEVVINYDVPSSPKAYVHRVGRAARAGRAGRAITLVTQYDLRLLKEIEDTIHSKLVLHTHQEVVVLAQLGDTIKAMKMSELFLEEHDFASILKKVKERRELARILLLQEVAEENMKNLFATAEPTSQAGAQAVKTNVKEAKPREVKPHAKQDAVEEEEEQAPPIFGKKRGLPKKQSPQVVHQTSKKSKKILKS